MTAMSAILAPDKSITAKRAAGRLLALVWWAPRPDPRARVVSAFRDIGIGASEKRAHERTKSWFRSGAGPWTKHLG